MLFLPHLFSPIRMHRIFLCRRHSQPQLLISLWDTLYLGMNSLEVKKYMILWKLDTDSMIPHLDPQILSWGIEAIIILVWSDTSIAVVLPKRARLSMGIKIIMNKIQRRDSMRVSQLTLFCRGQIFTKISHCWW